MPEPRTHVQATAAKIGNGAHVLVPKDWLGKEVLCIPKDQLVALVANLHGGGAARAPPARLVAGGSLAYTRAPDGWQVLALASREAKAATVWLAERAWRPFQARRLDGALVLEDAGTLVPLAPKQAAWLQALLDAEGIAATDLPSLGSQDALKRIREQLQVETDPARLKALAKELTRLLG